jgi:hypothetical protein
MATVTATGVGLLNGVDLEHDELYAKDLGNIDFIVEEKVFWEAATRDASARPESSTDAYLTKMKERLNAFGDGECLHITDRTLATARIEEFIEEKSLHSSWREKYGED